VRGIFGTKMEEVKVVWRKFHNEELHSSHASLNIIRMIKSPGE
jgi:NAD(P)H-nitrite reductase large subunit